MDKNEAKLFYQNAKWFNSFFADLKTFYDKLANIISKDLEYSESSFYYYKPNERPSIPTMYFLLLSGEGKLHIQIATIFDKNAVNNQIITVIEPCVTVVLHNYKHNENWITENILKNKNIRDIKKNKNGILSGTFKWDEKIKFYIFHVPLDLFLKYKDKTVEEEIISKIKDIN